MRGDELAAAFEARGPWITKFIIDGEPHGGDYDAAHDAAERVEQFHAAFPAATSILELGSFEGGHTASLAALPGVARVVGLEGRSENVARATFALEVLGVTNARVHEADLETFDLMTVGSFDAVFNCGVLYHLPRPWELLGRIAAVTEQMYLSTHYCADADADATDNGFSGHWYHEFGYDDRLSGLAATSFWPTRDALLEMLRRTGFEHTEVTFDEPDFPHGPLICLSTRT